MRNASLQQRLEHLLGGSASARMFLTTEAFTHHLNEMDFKRARSIVQIYMETMQVVEQTYNIGKTITNVVLVLEYRSS